MPWARPSATVLGIDVPPVIGSSSAIQASAAARVSRAARQAAEPAPGARRGVPPSRGGAGAVIVEERRIAVDELRTGMFVCRLDREWLGTPFPISEQRIMKAIKAIR